MKRYAGIGSRKTPPHIQTTMMSIAKRLAEQEWLLRSGGASGVDSSFEIGCDDSRGLKEIILPWARFNNSDSQFILPREDAVFDEAMRIASEVHPAWSNCNGSARLFHARNVLQILGMNLKEPVDLVVCWTPGGKIEGGTATGIKVAKLYEIPIINLGCLDPEKIETFVRLTGIRF